MTLLRLLTDRLQEVRRTRVTDDHGHHDEWADYGDPLPAKIGHRLTASAGVETHGTENSIVAIEQATILGWPAIPPTSQLRDSHGRVWDVEGPLIYAGDPSGRIKLTIAHLRYAQDL